MPDILQALRSTTLELVRVQDESDDVRSLCLKPNRTFRHRAGRHGLFTPPDRADTHPFTLASAPGEEHVIIGTRIGTGSAYKERLAHLGPGETMTMRGPLLDFTLSPEDHDVVLLAQGIGITPFRSMLVDVDLEQRPVTTHLVHVACGDHTYRELTCSLADDAAYVTGSADFTAAAASAAEHLGADAGYYLSGSPEFVKATTTLLTSKGVPAKRIKHDTFTGYTTKQA